MDLIDRRAAITSLTFAEETGRMSCGELKGVIEVLNRLPSAQPTQNNTPNALKSLDCIDRQAALDALKRAETLTRAFGYHCVIDTIQELPPAQPEMRHCVNCGRTVNNGGWYKDGRTRCPIEEHYPLPKDGYCHLWEKRNVTDDDYPERREE